MYNFKKSILNIIDIYTMHCEYKEKNISLTRTLAYYVKINNCFELIEYNDIKEIKKNYIKTIKLIIIYLLIMKIVIVSDESDYEKKTRRIFRFRIIF